MKKTRLLVVGIVLCITPILHSMDGGGAANESGIAATAAAFRALHDAQGGERGEGAQQRQGWSRFLMSNLELLGKGVEFVGKGIASSIDEMRKQTRQAHERNIQRYREREQAARDQIAEAEERLERYRREPRSYHAENWIRQEERTLRKATAEAEQFARLADAEVQRMEAEAAQGGGERFLTDQGAKITGMLTKVGETHLTSEHEQALAVIKANASKDEAVEIATRGIQETFAFLRSPRRLSIFVGAIVATFAGIYGAREMSKVVAEYIGARLGQPQLVRESSRETLLSSWWHTIIDKPESNGILDVVLKPDKEALLMEIADSTKEAHANGDPLMNVLFYGPPGTGKTMFAKALAEYSECDYAILSGADFSQFKAGEDITQLHSFFEWAKTSRRPLVVFVDEAETFLASRSNPNVSERSKKLTDAFLSQVTGQASDNIMFVFATNMPNLLDKAVMDRVGEKVEFPLPGHEERKRIFELHLKRFAERREIPVEEEVFEHLDEFAEQMDGFSGRTIAGIVLRSLRKMRSLRNSAISRTAVLETIEQEKITQADTTMASYI